MINLQNKRGMGTLINWAIVIVSVLLFIVILQSQVLDPMNDTYNQSHDTGIDTSGIDDFQSLKTSTDTELEGSEVSQTNDGLTFLSSAKIVLGFMKTATSFVSGNFINGIVVDTLNLPPVIANVLVILIWLSIILLVIYIVMKVPI